MDPLTGTLKPGWARCANPKCSAIFFKNPACPHKKYHCKSCGESARKRWQRPERRAYMKDFWRTYDRNATKKVVVE